MSTESVPGRTKPEREAKVTLLWILGISGSMSMLYYQYLWSRFALGNLASISMGGWLGTSLTIASPWIFCFLCLFLLRDGARSGSVGRDVCLTVSISVEMVMVSAYSMVAVIHRFPGGLAVLK